MKSGVSLRLYTYPTVVLELPLETGQEAVETILIAWLLGSVQALTDGRRTAPAPPAPPAISRFPPIFPSFRPIFFSLYPLSFVIFFRLWQDLEAERDGYTFLKDTCVGRVALANVLLVVCALFFVFLWALCVCFLARCL